MTITRDDLLEILRKLIARYCDQKIYNPEIPESHNGALLVTNHISRLDIVFLMLSTKRKDVIALTASNYRRAFFFSTILKKLGVIWLDRKAILRPCAKRLHTLKRAGLSVLLLKGNVPVPAN